jgi:hypothetical protein
MTIHQSTVGKMAWGLKIQDSTIGKFRAGLMFEQACENIDGMLHYDAR